jgi:hypothetical protein
VHGVRRAVLLWALAASASATSLEIGKVELVPPGSPAPRAVRFEVSWKNGWSNAKNHDAAWLFVKLAEQPGEPFGHARLAAAGHTAVAKPGSPPPRLEPSADGVGAFLYGGAPFRGDASFSVELVLDPKALAGLDPKAKPVPAVLGVEMVLVPEGKFWVGDPDPGPSTSPGSFSWVPTAGPRARSRSPPRIPSASARSPARWITGHRTRSTRATGRGRCPRGTPRAIARSTS